MVEDEIYPSWLHRGKKFVFIDEENLWNEILSSSGYRIKSELYDIQTPFLMDSEVAAAGKTKNAGSDEKSTEKRRKRKKSNTTDFLNSMTSQVTVAFQEFSEWVSEKEEKYPGKKYGNNEEARLAAANAGAVIDFCGVIPADEPSTTKKLTYKTVNEGSEMDVTVPLIAWMNERDCFVKVGIQKHEYLVPPMATLVPGHVAAIRSFDLEGLKFDFLVADPPWPNRSVKRCRTYSTFEPDDLLDLPVDSLLSQNGIVILWLTNSPSVHSAVPRILEAWDVEEVTRGAWLKVTKANETVYPLDSGHKVPYECFVIAMNSRASQNLREKIISFKEVTLISTPSACHSRKPPLVVVLRAILGLSDSPRDSPAGSGILELYARYALPYVTSVGFETLKFQHVESCFVTVNR